MCEWNGESRSGNEATLLAIPSMPTLPNYLRQFYESSISIQHILLLTVVWSQVGYHCTICTVIDDLGQIWQTRAHGVRLGFTFLAVCVGSSHQQSQIGVRLNHEVVRVHGLTRHYMGCIASWHWASILSFKALKQNGVTNFITHCPTLQCFLLKWLHIELAILKHLRLTY